MHKTLFSLVVVVLLFSFTASAQEKSFLQKLGFGGGASSLDEGTIGDGLRQALSVGIERTVVLVGKDDGYFKNEKIKIPPPKLFRRIEKPVRLAGYGPRIDEFVLSMNRAAEKAAPLAKDIFIKAIAEMSIDDAKKILHGGDTAATDYLNKHTRDRLTEAFLPPVKKTMGQYDVKKKYDAVMKQTASIPFLNARGEDSLEKYTVGKALDGLFYMLGQEEKRIREDPSARATDLLKKVFR